MLGDRRSPGVSALTRRRGSRSLVGLAAPFLPAVIALLLSMQRHHAPARVSVKSGRRKSSVEGSPDERLSSSHVRGDSLTGGRHRVGPAGVVARASRAPSVQARRRDGVAGFLLGLLLVTLALAAAVALAAQSVQ